MLLRDVRRRRERGEPLPFACCFAYAFHRLGHARPTLRPVRACWFAFPAIKQRFKPACRRRIGRGRQRGRDIAKLVSSTANIDVFGFVLPKRSGS